MTWTTISLIPALFLASLLLSCANENETQTGVDSLNAAHTELYIEGHPRGSLKVPNVIVEQLLKDLDSPETGKLTFPNDDGAEPLYIIRGEKHIFYIYGTSVSNTLYRKLDDNTLCLYENDRLEDFNALILHALDSADGFDSRESQELIQKYLSR